MKKFIYPFLLAIYFNTPCLADNVILMIGDGMGKNHITCTAKTTPLFLPTLKIKGDVTTYSASHTITDSAAGATAYSCGLKTKNSYLALDSNKTPCETLAEMSVKNGFKTLIRTTDVITGATPAAFYAHVDYRYKTQEIKEQLAKAQEQMDIKAVTHIDTEVKEVLAKLKKEKKPFFMMIEESEIDKQSHNNNYQKMQEALVRFDNAVKEAVNFAKRDKKTTVIVVADHETGGLTTHCNYTKNNHSSADVHYFAFGQHAKLFNQKVMDNTDIHHKIKQILFK